MNIIPDLRVIAFVVFKKFKF